MTVLCPKQTPKLSRLTASSQVLITARTRIITCVSRVLHVFTTCVTRGCPWAKFWAVQNFLPRPTPFRFFSASCHVYKSTVARLKLDINADNIVCFTGDNFLTGFGRDQAVKRCVTGPLMSEHPFMMTSWNGNIFRVIGPLYTGHRSLVNSPHIGQWRGVWCFIWSVPE